MSVRNTVIVRTIIPIYPSNFQFSSSINGVNSNLNEATLIWQHFRDTGLLDKRYFITSLFEYENSFSFDVPGVTGS